MTHWRDYFVQLMEKAVAGKPIDEWPEAIEQVYPREYMRRNRLSCRKWLQIKWQFIEERRKLAELQRAAGRRHATKGTV